LFNDFCSFSNLEHCNRNLLISSSNFLYYWMRSMQHLKQCQ
jgi:hypothetical protein